MPVSCREAISNRRHKRNATLVLRSKGLLAGLAAAVLGVSAIAPEIDAAFDSVRTISLYHIHTKETLTVTYKRDGKYDKDALKKINWLMRDWRENKQIEIDPATIDLLWEMHTELGSKEPIHIICGYRSSKTNNMLRRTRGGQAKRSYHLTGQAIDAAFPDVPIKRMRYSALIRERGGVGYYPTSGIPFVHVDTGRVRAWPRLPRYELALLFPDGKTRHRPSKGGPISRKDVHTARTHHKELATQVASYFELRNQPKTSTLVAQAPQPVLKVPEPKPAPTRPQEIQVASLTPIVPPQPMAAAPPRQNARAPDRLRPPAPISVPRPAAAEREKLNELVTLASLSWEPEVSRPPEADRKKLNTLFTHASLGGPTDTAGFRIPAPTVASQPRRRTSEPTEQPKRIAALEPAQRAHSGGSLTDTANGDWNTGWAPAPQFDEDHPDELSYRPFPLAPLLTQSASINDPAFVHLSHPDVARTLDLLGDEQIVLPMRLRPGQQVAEVMWAQQFQGRAVNISAIDEAAPTPAMSPVLASRSVKTTAK